MAESGVMELSGRGQPAPPHQLGGLRERCKLSQRSGVRGRAPATERFSCILSRQIAFPSISVGDAYSLHG